ncbi:penicillin-resistant DD-carboxypeptidase [Cystobacter fuscus]|uniref:Penicillin-resistant DD-carboxypeptidase n=1 Tax=Cystobacter fuscus TaxID=43 RepID=A0A250IZR1_9BACT|nr:peptidoglycan-binding domain-containing protein [Cystobacter fuscus]ATB37205.1 penicillin-resistant DD-carboxypeptidase [Cystobacter fuscus]
MIYLFHKAGLDEDIQRAQVQWTSYRISYAISRYRLSGSTNLGVLDGFLRSLGSNIPDELRLANANQAIREGTAEGIVYPRLDDIFSETGTQQGWRDWATRCADANKEMGGAAQGEAPAQQGQARSPVLRQGARGADVTELQRRLQRAGVFQGNVDGVFGPGTAEAVRQFQSSQPGLQADGIVGPGTWNSLNGARPSP